MRKGNFCIFYKSNEKAFQNETLYADMGWKDVEYLIFVRFYGNGGGQVRVALLLRCVAYTLVYT